MKQITLTIIWIALVAAMLVNKGVQAQNLAFEKLYCTTELDMRINDMLLMPTASIYLVGYDTVNNATTQGSAVIRKFDKDFNLIWEKKYGGSGYDNFNFIEYMSDNRLLVRGVTNSQDGDVLNNYPMGNNEWVCIMDTNGNILHQLIWGAGGNAFSIKIGPNGDIYFCGSTYSNLYDYVGNGPFDFADDGYISCADSLLNKKWVHFFEVNPGNSTVWDIGFLPNGHLMLVCTSNDINGAFAVNTPNPKGGTILMEIDTLLNVYWQKRYGGIDPDPNVYDGVMRTIHKDTNGINYYIGGVCKNKTGDCWDTYPYLNKGDHKYRWIMKIDTIGNKIWSHIYGEFSNDGSATHNGLVNNLFYNNCWLLPEIVNGSDAYDFGTAIGKMDTWLISIDSNGVLYKHNRVGYPNVSWYPNIGKQNPITKEIYYVYYDYKAPGYTPSPNICDTSASGILQQIIGKYNYWPDRIEERDKLAIEFVVYPNPARDEITIDKIMIGTLIEIYNLEGKKIKTLKASKMLETISVSGWQRGTYLIKASYKKQTSTQKIILQ